MIQRVQTIFLALVSITALLLIFTDFASFFADGDEFKLNIWGIERVEKDINFSPVVSVSLMAFCFALIVMPLISIFQYKKRKNQISIGYAILGLSIGTELLIGYYIWDIASFIPPFETIETSYGFGLVLPLIALIFNQLALIQIKKDEKLVKSLDRLR